MTPPEHPPYPYANWPYLLASSSGRGFVWSTLLLWIMSERRADIDPQPHTRTPDPPVDE